jgi:hypothetical protein
VLICTFSQEPGAAGGGKHGFCIAAVEVQTTMSKAKHTNVKRPHKDSAAKNTMNPLTPSGGAQQLPATADQDRDPKGRIGQYGGAGEHPIQKY